MYESMFYLDKISLNWTLIELTKQKQLTEIHYDWTAGSNKGTASYTNINQQKISVPNDVIQAAAKNSDSIDNNNDDNSDDE